MQLDDAYAAVALRAVVATFDANPAGAGALLLRVLATDPAPPITQPPEPGRKRGRPRGRPRAPVPVARPDPETARLLAAAVKRHGSVTDAATAAGVSRAAWSSWRTGRTKPSPESADRLRASLEDAEPDAPAVTDDAEPEPAAPPAVTEAAGLIAILRERHGDAVGERFGWGDAALLRWSNGGACSPTVIARLKQAVASPMPPREANRATPDRVAGED